MDQELTNASVACVEVDAILLIQRSPREPTYAGLWEFPGGRIEPGEAPADAAVRECVEECGSRVIIGAKVGEFSWKDNGETRAEVVFAGRLLDAIRLNAEHCAFAWVRMADLESGRYAVSAETETMASKMLRKANRQTGT